MIMEKLIEKYTMERVFRVIDKHKSKFDDMIEEMVKLKAIGDVLGEDTSWCDRELESYASALATLELLTRELKGEEVY